MTLLQHVFPPFDAWWPNIIGSAVWGIPTLVLGAVHVVRSHRSRLSLHAKLDELHAHFRVDQKKEEI